MEDDTTGNSRLRTLPNMNSGPKEAVNRPRSTFTHRSVSSHSAFSLVRLTERNVNVKSEGNE